MTPPTKSSTPTRRSPLAVLATGVLAFGVAATWPTGALAGHVRGAVKDKKGKPVPNVIVTVWDLDTKGRKKMVSGTTDGKGQYDLKYSDNYREPGDAFGGGTFPDIHVTFELQSKFSTKSFYKKAVKNELDGPLVKVHDWPKKLRGQMANWNPKADLVVPVVVLPADEWEMVRTTFDPRVHSFSWKNTDRNVCWGPTCKTPWKALFSTPQALCGGMALTAFKHWAEGECDVAKIELVDGKFPKALKKEVVENQLETFFLPAYLRDPDAPGWEIIRQIVANPIAMLPVTTPGFRFFEWQAKRDYSGGQLGNTIGASTKAEWPKLYPELRDRHLPVVLGLINAQAPSFNWADVDIINKNHQVLAIGYDHNPRFKSVTIYVYDPNAPKQVHELRFSYKLTNSKMHLEYSKNSKTRGWFVGTVAPDYVYPPKVECSLPEFRKK